MCHEDTPRLYGDVAGWVHLLTAPPVYEAGAVSAIRTFTEALGAPPATILELGSGGGNHASRMKAHATLTLSDGRWLRYLQWRWDPEPDDDWTTWRTCCVRPTER